MISSTLETIPCPLCADSQFRSVSNTNVDYHLEKYGDIYKGQNKSHWVSCESCGFVYQNPRPTTKALNDFYENSQYHSDVHAWNPERYAEFGLWYYTDKVKAIERMTGLGAGSVVFDVGFGMGGALWAFSKRGWKVSGVESDKESFNFVKKKFGFSNIENSILTSKISETHQVDLIFSNHVFEHVADLNDVLIGIRKILKPGGYVFTCVPTYKKNRSRLSKLWMNSAHYNIFTDHSLNYLFAKNGFKPIHSTYRGFLKEIDEVWHLVQYDGATRDLNEFKESASWAQIYLAFINPLRSVLFWPLFSNWSKRVEVFGRLQRFVGILFSNPSVALKKISRKMRG